MVRFLYIYIYIFRLFEGFVRNKLEKSFTQNGMDLSFKKKLILFTVKMDVLLFEDFFLEQNPYRKDDFLVKQGGFLPPASW